MTIAIRDGGNTQRIITAIQVRDGTNTARDISEIWVRDSNNVSRQVFSLASPVLAVATPDAIGGTSPGTGTVTTDNATTCGASGGTPPYTYLWAVVSYTNFAPPTADTPTVSTTYFTQTGVAEADSAVFRCTVTDDNGATATADCSAYFINLAP